MRLALILATLATVAAVAVAGAVYVALTTEL